ncbi:MAG: alpha/beta fold hydrolase [Eubacteriaceae bacterium]|jgi:pimeloyl-ACP methyl ester carboxylesterase
MRFKETGKTINPKMIFLHGGGLSAWSLDPVVAMLENKFNVIRPVIDGHAEDGKETFLSIEDSAAKLIDYIDHHCNGKVHLLCGLSIGAQIVTEVLTQREDITDFAVIESALVIPIKKTTAVMAPINSLSYGLIGNKSFSKMQAKALCVPSEKFERYHQDSLKMSKQSLINMVRSNGTYALKQNISKTKAKVLIVVGQKELGIMKKSAFLLNREIPHSRLFVAKGMKHGELSLKYPERFVELIKELLSTSDSLDFEKA